MEDSGFRWQVFRYIFYPRMDKTALGQEWRNAALADQRCRSMSRSGDIHRRSHGLHEPSNILPY